VKIVSQGPSKLKLFKHSCRPMLRLAPASMETLGLRFADMPTLRLGFRPADMPTLRLGLMLAEITNDTLSSAEPVDGVIAVPIVVDGARDEGGEVI
jgi:hypothetical protein